LQTFITRHSADHDKIFTQHRYNEWALVKVPLQQRFTTDDATMHSSLNGSE